MSVYNQYKKQMIIDVDEDSSQEFIQFHQQSYEPSKDTPVDRILPWLSPTTKSIDDLYLKMHSQIIDYSLYTMPQSISPERQQEFTVINKQDIVQRRVKNAIKEANPQVKFLSPFFEHRLYLKNTEIQLFAFIPVLNNQTINQIVQKLGALASYHLSPMQNRESFPIYEFQLQLSPTVILRILDPSMYDFIDGISPNLNKIKELPFLYMIMTTIVRQRWMHLNIRSFVVYSLLLAFYTSKKKQKGKLLSQQLLKFLQLFNSEFQNDKMLTYNMGSFSIDHQKEFRDNALSIYVNKKNISSFLIRDLLTVLKNRYRILSSYHFEDSQSIIWLLVNPNLDNFEF